ncbi:MAG: hypothetical protein HYU64_10860 [Armatimonadetes bacterium]|nr:hypothetical protein [Armatimonadota bacterium]
MNSTFSLIGPTIGDIHSRPSRTRQSASLQESEGYVETGDRHVSSPVETNEVTRQLDDLARIGRSSGLSALEIDETTGKVALLDESKVENLPETRHVLPLRLDPLRSAFDSIEKSDPWLMERKPVFYFDLAGQVHIDYVSLAGFVVDPMGSVLSRSVNPW